MPETVGRARACRHCGKAIRFNVTYDAAGSRKYTPANIDGSDHRCLTEIKTHGPRTLDDVIRDMANAMEIPSDGKTSGELAKDIGHQLGQTPAEVAQRASQLLKLEQINGQGGSRNGGNNSGHKGESGGDSSSGDVSEVVDQAIENALRSKNNSRGKADSTGEGSSGEGVKSDQASEDSTSGSETEPNGTGEGSPEGKDGTATKGPRAKKASGGNEEGVSESSEAGEGQEGDGEKDEESGAEAREKDAENADGDEQSKDEAESVKDKEVKVDKEVLKQIAQILKDQIKQETTQKIEHKLVLPDESEVDITGEHFMFKEFVQLLIEGEKPFLVGPAGSGKTTAALNAAPVLGKVFEREDYTTYVKSFCLMSGKHEMEGFIDANGHVVDTDFRTAFLEGHLFFMDEADAANPNILLVLNAAIENKVMSFPDGMKRAHEHFRVAVGANTIGLGADAQYSGRTQLDAAFRNRFYFLAWEYDEQMELKWAGEDQKEWVAFVQGLRKAQQGMGRSAPRVVISPRASIRGARRLRSGIVPADNAGFATLAEALIWQGCHEDDKRKILENATKKRR